MRRLLARCQIAVWAYQDYKTDIKALEAAPWGQFIADSFFVTVAAVFGIQPILWRNDA